MSFDPALPRGVDAAMRWLTKRFGRAGLAAPALDARLLVLAAAQISHEAMIRDPAHELTQEQISLLEDYAARRLVHEPVSRILATREFRSREFRVCPHVLDPRSDSETLIEAALEGLDPDASWRILDLGTGSGCLLITLLAELPGASGIGVDLCPDALECARGNAVRHAVGLRAGFVCGDWYGALDGKFDLVIANPPYISHGDLAALPPDVIGYDPVLALDGGDDGLDAYRAILSGITDIMKPQARLVMEIGNGQETALITMMRRAGLAETGAYADLAGHIRVLKGKFENN